jgi:succinate dehydrogenase/fumarate reductase flavoprotein subunit
LLQATGAGLAGGALAGSAAATEDVVWDASYDVVVCGSGAAGATAALYAARAGASVLVIEKSTVWGGTTAKSGCHIWIPNNFELRERGIRDERLACLRYMAHYSYPDRFQPDHPTLGLDDNTFELLAAFYDNAAAMVDEMMAWGAFRYRVATIKPEGEFTPDYYDHSPWNAVPAGRGMEPWDPERQISGGRNVVQQMRRALEAAGVEILMRTAAHQLLRDPEGRVAGLVALAADGLEMRIGARQGVVFATGCYSHNDTYLQQFQMVPVFGSCAVPSNQGDFIRIAGEVGAQLGNMSGAWRSQVVLANSVEYEAVPAAVYWPPGDSMLLVNRYGRRFVNEKRGYNDRTRQMYDYDASRVEYPNLVSFMIYDQRAADLWAGNYPIPPVPEAAGYVIQSPSLAGLADGIAEQLEAMAAQTGGVVLDEAFVATLASTVERFNELARRGSDEDFGRGDYREDRDWFRLFGERPGTAWTPAQRGGSTLYPLQAEGPYYAIILVPGLLGTNGGPRINARAEVLDWNDQPIPGLYGAGNCIAHPAGNAYWAAGATIGSAMTFGKIAGEQVASRVQGQSA